MTQEKVIIRSGKIASREHETANTRMDEQSISIGRSVVTVREDKPSSRILLLNRRLSGKMKAYSDSSR